MPTCEVASKLASRAKPPRPTARPRTPAARGLPGGRGAAQPYLRLAAALAEQAGDHATTAVLLAARLVRLALEAERDGLPVAASLDGYALAARQALARLRTLRAPDDGACLESVAPGRPGW